MSETTSQTAKPKRSTKPKAATKSSEDEASASSGSSSADESKNSGTDAGESAEQPWWYASSADSDEPNPVDVGTAAQEAVKLAGALAQWAEQSGLAETLKGIAEQAAASVLSAAKAASSPGSAEGETESESASESPAGHSTTCDSCPICQGVDMVKTMSPEAADGITEALAAVTTAVRQTLDGFVGSAEESPTRVEHIDID